MDCFNGLNDDGSPIFVQQYLARLRVILQKELRNRDVSQLGRIVLPKVSYCANQFFSKLSIFRLLHIISPSDPVLNYQILSCGLMNSSEGGRGLPPYSDIERWKEFVYARFAKYATVDLQIQVGNFEITTGYNFCYIECTGYDPSLLPCATTSGYEIVRNRKNVMNHVYLSFVCPFLILITY
jgi:hypothetical protein